VGKVCLTNAPPKRILHVALDALTDFTKYHLLDKPMAEAMVTPRRKCRRPAMVTPKSYPYP